MPTYHKGDIRPYIEAYIDQLAAPSTSFQPRSANNPTVDVLLFSANNVITRHNKLVMGAGFAKWVRDKFDKVDERLTFPITHMPSFNKKRAGEYGLALCPIGCADWPFPIGAFQTKRHPSESSDIKLVELATDLLYFEATQNMSLNYHLNMPAVGLGGLDIGSVMTVLSILPQNVHIWCHDIGHKLLERYRTGHPLIEHV